MIKNKTKKKQTLSGKSNCTTKKKKTASLRFNPGPSALQGNSQTTEPLYHYKSVTSAYKNLVLSLRPVPIMLVKL